ncbi:glycosyltransferase [Neokomagataea anthophila]|uniref:Glycosyltransferase n=1 Tax=Neokomagataea anthophila TaxID=2826925 RepID=A0ABS5E682_9PROT|nr:glycosyltransferase [Neokomagataea anthophila]MBR0559406.1 glycosyltransferase [Neokomagataea anthophila]
MSVEYPKIAAVIVTCNRFDKLKTTLSKTLALPFSSVVVIDNASHDETPNYLQSLSDKRLCCIRQEKNLGGAGGFALGFQIAADHTDAEWLLCFDDDSYPQPDVFENFIALPLTEDVGGVAAAVYYPDQTICPMNRPGVNIFGSPFSVWEKLKKNQGALGLPDSAYASSESVEVSFSSFVGFFVRRSLVKRSIGLPDKDLFIYRDDSIYTLSLTKKGYKLLFAPDVRFVHDCGTPSAGRRVYNPLWKAYYIIRNDMPFFKKISGMYFCLLLPMLFFKSIRSTFFYRKPWSFLHVALVATWDGLRNDFSKSHKAVLELAER